MTIIESNSIRYYLCNESIEPYWLGHDGISYYIVKSEEIINKLNKLYRCKQREQKLNRIENESK